ncbi:MAG: DUF3089 domain-containing protein [Chitinophagia bacterium]
MRHFLPLFILVVMSSCAQSNYAKLEPIYEKQQLGELPDYSNLNYWSAHPDKKSPSDSVPAALSKNYRPVQLVDVFYIHPTTYLDSTKPYGMNASFKDIKTNISTDYTAVLNQASIFNEVGRIYAPRYRQAHIKSYSPVDQKDTVIAIAAFELAYQDVKAAFTYYMAHENKGRPIIIASHSQGSTHAIRLLKEFFDNQPLEKKLVAAYVVGMAIDPSTYVQLKACEKPNSTGCICAWRTFQEGYLPDFVVKEKFSSIVTNPISWNAKDTIVDRSLNEGAVLYNFNKITTHVVGAINHEGVLWTKKPQFLGSFLYTTKNFHIADYNFYYLSVRKNVAERVNTYLSINNNYTH